MALPRQNEILKIVIDHTLNAVTVRKREVAIDSDGTKYACGELQEAFMPDQFEDLKKFTGREQGLEHQAAAELWTQEAIAARYEREGRDSAGQPTKPLADFTEEEKKNYNDAVPDKAKLR